MVVLRGLQQYPEQPVGPRAAAQRQHRLIQILLGLQGQQQLRGQENIQHNFVSRSDPIEIARILIRVLVMTLS